MGDRGGGDGAVFGGTAEGRPQFGPEAGYRALVSAMVLNLVSDLSTLHRAGCWEDELAELDEWMETRVSRAEVTSNVRAAYQAGMTKRSYLETICAVMYGALGVMASPEQVVAAARQGRPAQRREAPRRKKVKMDAKVTCGSMREWLGKRDEGPPQGAWAWRPQQEGGA